MLKHRTLINRLWHQTPPLPPDEIILKWLNEDGTPNSIFTPDFHLYINDDGSAELQTPNPDPAEEAISRFLTAEELKADLHLQQYINRRVEHQE